MARRPFFSGDYGSALGSYDTAARLLAQAGQTQGAAMAGLGGNIAGAIEKYGLNKEQQKKDKGFLKGALAGIKSLKEGDPNPESSILYDSIIAQAEDENIPLSQRVAMVKQGQQQINISGQQQLRNSLMSSRDMANRSAQQILDMRTRLAEKEKEESDLRSSLNKSLNVELKEYRDTLAGLEPSERDAFEPTPRGKWLEQLAPLIERSAVPTRDAIFDPTKARITKLGLSELEQKHRADRAKEEAYSPADQARDLKEIRSMEMRNAESLINARDAAAKAGIIKALGGAGLPGFAELAADADQLLDRKTIQIPGQSEPVSLVEYYELHDGEPTLYPLTGPGSGMAGNMHGQYMLLLNKAKASDPQVQADVTAGRGAPGVLPPEIASMTPAGVPAKISDIKNQISILEQEAERLGQPGGMMATYPPAAGPGAAPAPLPASTPATLGYANRRRQEISQEIQALNAQLQQINAVATGVAP